MTMAGPTPPKKSRLSLIALVVVIVSIAAAAMGIVSRAEEESRLRQRTEASAIPAVVAMTAETGTQSDEIVLPGTVQAWHEATIYARTNGYLKGWTTDIGASVKTGDVLAEIDAPDLDAQFHQAQADLNTAIANNDLAQITAKRYIELLKSNSVSKQDADTKIATAAADAAAVESAKANLDHLQQEETFKKVTAPFDGIVTQRNTDVGALIIGGAGGAGQELFHIAQTDKLRVYVQVPENDTAVVTSDLTAMLYFPQDTQKPYEAHLTHSADALDPVTRTLLIELQVDNADGVLKSGGYADAHLKVPQGANHIIMPVNVLLFRDGLQVAIVKDNHVSLRRITLGHDFGKNAEIISGVTVGDKVVLNPPDSLQDGQEVRLITPSKNPQK